MQRSPALKTQPAAAQRCVQSAYGYWLKTAE